MVRQNAHIARRRRRHRGRAVAVAAAIGLALALVSVAHAKKRPPFDESDGFEDPNKRSYPRTHRFRLALESGYVRLSAAIDGRTGETVRFHYAPLILNAGYQAQFARVLSARLSVGFGGNVANSRTAMPLVLNPRAHFGYQGRWFGIFGTYGYMFMFPGVIDARNDRVAMGLNQPYLEHVHQFGGEASITSRVDRVAYSFSIGMVAARTTLCHLDFDCRENPKATKRIYPMLTLGAALYFDGSIRRARRRDKSATAAVTWPAPAP